MKTFASTSPCTAEPRVAQHPAASLPVQAYAAPGRLGAVTPQAIADSPRQAVSGAQQPVQLVRKCGHCKKEGHTQDKCLEKYAAEQAKKGKKSVSISSYFGTSQPSGQPGPMTTPPTNQVAQAPLSTTASTIPLQQPTVLPPITAPLNSLGPGPQPGPTTTQVSNTLAPLPGPKQDVQSTTTTTVASPGLKGNWLAAFRPAEAPMTKAVPKPWIKKRDVENGLKNQKADGPGILYQHSRQNTPENSDDEDVMRDEDGEPLRESNPPDLSTHFFTDLTQEQLSAPKPKKSGETITIDITPGVRSDVRATAALDNEIISLNGPLEATDAPADKQMDRETSNLRRRLRDRYWDVFTNHDIVVAHKPDRRYNDNKAGSLAGWHAQSAAANKLEGGAFQRGKPTVEGYIIKQKAKNGNIVYSKPTLAGREARKLRQQQALHADEQVTDESQRRKRRKQEVIVLPTATCRGNGGLPKAPHDDEPDDQSGGGFQGGGSNLLSLLNDGQTA